MVCQRIFSDPEGSGQHCEREKKKCKLQKIFIHSFNKYLLSTYYAPGSVLGCGDSVVNKTKHLPSCHLNCHGEHP